MTDAFDPDLQHLRTETDRGRITTMDSAYDVRTWNKGRDVVVNASYCGVLPARFIGRHAPRGAIGVDCGWPIRFEKNAARPGGRRR